MTIVKPMIGHSTIKPPGTRAKNQALLTYPWVAE